MFRTIPAREKRLIIKEKTEMDFFPKESQYTESWTAKLLKKKYYSRKNTTVEHLHVRPPLAKVTGHLAS